MDRDGTEFLNGEYCFADGTFKRCLGFVTLSVYVYVGLLGKMIKLATMKAESENTENWLIFWNLLNQVISPFLSRKEKFNPFGWCVDEAGGVWKALRDIYGEEAIKHRTVSCEKHFSWSTENFKSTLQKTSKCAAIFESLPHELMTSETPTKYDAALNEIIFFIEKKKTRKRSFLRGFVEFWHPRRHHFSRVFKNSNAPTTNMSETYHSS